MNIYKRWLSPQSHRENILVISVNPILIFFYPKRNLETNRNLKRNQGLFISFILNALKTNLLCEITQRISFQNRCGRAYFFSKYMWETVFLFKIHGGERIYFQYTCGTAYFFSKYMWESVFLFKIHVGERISFQNTCGRAYFYSKYMWESVFLFKIHVGERISFSPI